MNAREAYYEQLILSVTSRLHHNFSILPVVRSSDCYLLLEALFMNLNDEEKLNLLIQAGFLIGLGVFCIIFFNGKPEAEEIGRFDKMDDCFTARELIVERIGRPIKNYQATCLIKEVI